MCVQVCVCVCVSVSVSVSKSVCVRMCVGERNRVPALCFSCNGRGVVIVTRQQWRFSSFVLLVKQAIKVVLCWGQDARVLDPT